MAIEFIDQMHQTIRLDKVPSRIVSLVPSQTELLAELGLASEVVGITKFCIYPEQWFQDKVRIGGTKAVDIEKVRALQPDLIIGNKEENTVEDILALQAIAPVWMSDISSYEDALEMIQALGDICGKTEKATQLISIIQHSFSSIQPMAITKKVLYFIWNAPNFVAGKSTFIHAMLEKCGFENYCNENRYPAWESSSDEVDLVFLSSEPFPFSEKHIESFQQQFQNATVVLVDGEYFSWYGSRLKDAPRYFQGLIHQLTEQEESN